MTDIAVQVNGLSKKYRIGGTKVKYKTLRTSITELGDCPRPPHQAADER